MCFYKWEKKIYEKNPELKCWRRGVRGVSGLKVSSSAHGIAC